MSAFENISVCPMTDIVPMPGVVALEVEDTNFGGEVAPVCFDFHCFEVHRMSLEFEFDIFDEGTSF